MGSNIGFIEPIQSFKLNLYLGGEHNIQFTNVQNGIGTKDGAV